MRHALVVVALLSAVGNGSAKEASSAAKNAVFNFSVFVAGGVLCEELRTNKDMATKAKIVARALLDEQSFEEEQTKAFESIMRMENTEGRQRFCAALLELYGPEGTTFKGALERK